jgi:phage/plasmid-like protein (TIGR03299 family)
MSQETMQWLNTNTLVGFTDKRGTAWHYRASEQGSEPNHYPGPIPVADVRRRLFFWTAQEVPVFHQVSCEVDNMFGISGIDDDGRAYQVRPIPDTKAIRRSDTNTILGIFKDGYQPHQPEAWLLGNVANLLTDELGIGSAGLLKGGAQAWVQVEVPDNVTTPQGVTFRPNLLAATSFDGSLSTTYKRTATIVVCDNTMSQGLGERGQSYKVKHSRYSNLKIEDARHALQLVETAGQDFAAEIAKLTSWPVTTPQWSRLLDKVVPIPADKGRSFTLATNKRDSLQRLYTFDSRVAPWNGTAFGVLQAFNTYSHHESIVRGAERAERNMANAVLGITEASDAEILAELAQLAPVAS